MSNKKIELKEAISIGIGGMVGGGIFAVLGLAVSLAKGGTPIAFLIAGIIALLTSYSYVKLSQTFPDRGGTVKFINKGFGMGVFSGTTNNLLWISYIIMLALYASAFGSYAPNLLKLTSNKTIDAHLYATSIILFATTINYYSIKVVGQIESYAVIIKLIILLGFVVIGIYGLFGNPNLEQLAISNWKSPSSLLASGMVIFVAYEGFELIANAAPDIINPIKNIPKAYYYSVIFVIFLYITIAAITVGSLPFAKIAEAQEYVLAEAAKPLLGKIGFTTITIAALISTFSAINASLYGGSRVSYEIAEDDELPHELTSKLWNQPIGLLITAISTIILVNVLNLESISITGSIGFLLIFAIVNYIGFKLSKKINGNKIIPLIGFISCIIALITLITQQYKTNSVGILISVLILISCFIFELIYKKQR
ncbi:Inner membrane transport protein YbaT [Polaribacter huanghezhanensis]|uniref:APC family permease n=1 Tax=Polaribacter huanghezhanensis TaxID=1354726 RepID=UPI0026495309|nr:APC family permease [Polaribacter huanghezhanensis]WKD84969.1 Inner membrane transport protein YbaT [Polaribacter huanghezhanensis]